MGGNKGWSLKTTCTDFNLAIGGCTYVGISLFRVDEINSPTIITNKIDYDLWLLQGYMYGARVILNSG